MKYFLLSVQKDLTNREQKRILRIDPFLYCLIYIESAFYQTVTKEFFESTASRKIYFGLNQLISNFVIYLNQIFSRKYFGISIQNRLSFVHVIVQFRVYSVD